MKLSIVTTLYQSEPYVKAFCEAASKAAKNITDDFEIVLVNDGSPDQSLAVALEERRNHPQLVVVDLSRNFGHHHAMAAALSLAKGDLVFILDSDLEDDPQTLSSFFKMLQQEQCDVVYGVQESRKGKSFERTSGGLFWSIFNWLSRTKVRPNNVNMRLMTRRYVDALLQFKEREIFMTGLWELTGFKQVAMPVARRDKGKSSYTLGKKIHLAIEAITSFSDRPLVFIFYTGIAICLVSALYLAMIFVRFLMYGTPVLGWPSLISSIWFLGGMMILFLGIIGIYVSKIFLEAKGRPTFIVRQIYGRGHAQDSL